MTKANRLSVAAFSDQLKRAGACTDCGGKFHPAAMQYDHLPGTVKLGNPSDFARTGRRQRFLAEIEKCELVCANCHAVRTVTRRQNNG